MLVNLRKSLLRELDFTIEANNLSTIGQNLAEFDQIIASIRFEPRASSPSPSP